MADSKPMALLWTITTVLVCFQGSIHQVEAENKFLDVLQSLHRIKRFGDDGGFRADWVPPPPPWITTNATGNETTIPEGDGLPPPVFMCQGCIEGDGLPPIVPPIVVPGKPQKPKHKVNNSGKHVGLSENKGIAHIIGNGKGRDKAEANEAFLDKVQRFLHIIKRFGDEGGFRGDSLMSLPPSMAINTTGEGKNKSEVGGLSPQVGSGHDCTDESKLPLNEKTGKPRRPNHKKKWDKRRTHRLIERLNNDKTETSMHMGANREIGRVENDSKRQVTTNQHPSKGNLLMGKLQKAGSGYSHE